MIFGWRKRSEGFEWREYVRTTILVRRAHREKRIEDARQAAFDHLKDARDRGLDMGARGAGYVRDTAVETGQHVGHSLLGALAGLGRAIAAGGRKAGAAFGNVANAVPVPSGMKRAGGLAALYAGDLPRRWRLFKPYIPAAAGAGALLFVFGTVLAPDASRLNITGSIAKSSSEAASETADNVVTGRATAISGDLLRINGRLLRLAGIDAPDLSQPCLKANGRRWSCAGSATSALSKLVRGQRLVCELKDGRAETPALANCHAGQTDVAAELVRDGYAFANAEAALYASEEEAARTAKAGVWQGEAERPEVWRAKVWDEAKRSAPDGCPIKGLIRSGDKVYSMPWTEGYSDRPVRAVKGERWFCNEDEAIAAGFKSASRS